MSCILYIQYHTDEFRNELKYTAFKVCIVSVLVVGKRRDLDLDAVVFIKVIQKGITTLAQKKININNYVTVSNILYFIDF